MAKRIRFTETREYIEQPTNKVYEAGKEYTLRNDLADRWITRGAAEFVADVPDDAIFNAPPPAASTSAPPSDATPASTEETPAADKKGGKGK